MLVVHYSKLSQFYEFQVGHEYVRACKNLRELQNAIRFSDWNPSLRKRNTTIGQRAHLITITATSYLHILANEIAVRYGRS